MVWAGGGGMYCTVGAGFQVLIVKCTPHACTHVVSIQYNNIGHFSYVSFLCVPLPPVDPCV